MYQLRQPVEAVQYTEGAASNVMDLVKTVRQHPSFTTAAGGVLHVYNDGPELSIQRGQWVVKIGTDVAVLGDSEFQGLFEEV